MDIAGLFARPDHCEHLVTVTTTVLTRAAGAPAMAAGSQVVTQGVGEALLGSSDLSTALSVSLGWVVNVVAAEWMIRGPAIRRRGAPEPLSWGPDHVDLGGVLVSVTPFDGRGRTTPT